MSECHYTTAAAKSATIQEVETPKQSGRVILVGNPNVGKSVMFSLLTGKYVTVSNYPGTTVEITTGAGRIGNRIVEVIDTPGANSLLPMSEDEKVTRNIIISQPEATILQVADSKNLKRALYLTLQLAELGCPMVLALNMEDEARSRGIKIDTQRLAELLGIEVVTTVATQRQGIDQVLSGLARPKVAGLTPEYDPRLSEACVRIAQLLPRSGSGQLGVQAAGRALALLYLSGVNGLNGAVKGLTEQIERQIAEIRAAVQKHYGQTLDQVIARQRLRQAEQLTAQVMTVRSGLHTNWATWLGNQAMHPVWGAVVLSGVLWLMYEFVGVFGAGTAVDFLENIIFGKVLNPLATRLFSLVPIELLRDFFVGQYGVITMALTYSVAIVLPVVATFFIAFSFLEDSGYFPRLALMVDKIFKGMGLNGKAVLPMVLGLGCDTMATLTTRILETPKERVIVTLLLALGVPCSAQLGVVLGILAGLSFTATALWVSIVILILFLVGFLSAQVIKGKRSDFVLEIPPIRLPQVSNIASKTFARVEWYLKEAVPLFIIGTIILFILDKTGALAVIEKIGRPIVVDWLSLPQEASAAFILGFLRRDYGAAGLFMLAKDGKLDPVQIVVSLVVITLFIPCMANFLIMIKERGLKVGLAIAAFIVPFAFLIGGVVNWSLRILGVHL